MIYVQKLLLKSISKFHFTHKLLQKQNAVTCIHGWLPRKWSFGKVVFGHSHKSQ